MMVNCKSVYIFTDRDSSPCVCIPTVHVLVAEVGGFCHASYHLTATAPHVVRVEQDGHPAADLLYMKLGLNFFITESGFETCFGWDLQHQRC